MKILNFIKGNTFSYNWRRSHTKYPGSLRLICFIEHLDKWWKINYIKKLSGHINPSGPSIIRIENSLLSWFLHKNGHFWLEHDGIHQILEVQQTPSWYNSGVNYAVIFQGSWQKPAQDQAIRCIWDGDVAKENFFFMHWKISNNSIELNDL